MKLKAMFFVFFFPAQNAFAAELRVPGPPVRPPAGSPGTGLNGSFFAARDVGGNNDSALSVALESRSSVSFLARLIDYGNGERGGQLLQTFLGAHLFDPHATYIKGPGDLDVNPSVFRFTGNINITRPVVNFAVTSDDGSRLSIDGVRVIDNPGAHNNNFGPGVVTVRFPAPGLYPIEILYNETQGQGANLGFFSDIPGGSATCLLCGAQAPDGTVGVVPTAVLFPEKGRNLSSPLTSGEKASRLWVELSQPSGGVGDLIEGTVGLASSTERFARADSDVPIILQTDTGKFPEGNRRVIPKGDSSVTFKIIIEKVGDFLVRASSPAEKIHPAQTGGTGCDDDGDVERMVVVQPTSEGTVGGPRIPFSLRFVDHTGTKPVKAKEDRVYELQPRGVVDVWPVRQQQVLGTLKKGQCVDDYLASSTRQGEGAVMITFEHEHKLPFTFYLQLQPDWFLLTTLGSICGAFVRLQTRSARTKKLLRYYFVAIIAGIGLFLFCYYFPSNQGARITVDRGSAFLLGLAGGYLGPMTVDKISKFLLASPHRRTTQRGQS